MKFRKLIGKAEKIVDSHEQGHPVENEDLARLQHLLAEKISRYEARLKTIEDSKKREKLQTRLKVVNAQLKKSEKLSSR
jgi:hypothetical protein